MNALGEKTSYAYDNLGNMVSQTDGEGNTTYFEYNARNLVEKTYRSKRTKRTSRKLHIRS